MLIWAYRTVNSFRIVQWWMCNRERIPSLIAVESGSPGKSQSYHASGFKYCWAFFGQQAKRHLSWLNPLFHHINQKMLTWLSWIPSDKTVWICSGSAHVHVYYIVYTEGQIIISRKYCYILWRSMFSLQSVQTLMKSCISS